MSRRKAQQLLANPPECLRKPQKTYFYGTAGYRSIADESLVKCICRASLVAFIRSSTYASKYVGLMVTASHNPENDNGMKMVDYNGDCVDEAWERLFDEVVNCEDASLYTILNRIHKKCGQMKDFGDGLPAKILLGRDTRSSGENILGAVKKILADLDVDVHDYGVVSTPQLHWLVRSCNVKGGIETKDKYIHHLTKGYEKLVDLRNEEGTAAIPVGRKVDTSNGVVTNIIKCVKGLNVELVNGFGRLNYMCGSDYVKSKRKGPPGIKSSDFIASFDGDADRLIYFRTDPFDLLDGDKLCCLLISMFVKLFEHVRNEIKIGAVLSFYSNTAAVRWAERLASVSISHTGVKNFIRLARTYDVGVYFEPNGHGSCYFSPKALKYINDGTSLECRKLQVLSKLFDPSIGDSLANFLIFETMVNFGTELYEEFPTRDLVVQVKDKNVVIINANNEVVEPANLQPQINDLLKKFKGKGFIRPSGTEDCIRIHAEARKQGATDELCVNLAQLVYDMCGGVGNCPEISYIDNIQ